MTGGASPGRVRRYATRVHRLQYRALKRFHWRQKARLLRAYRADPRANLGYVLWDPEADNFTYDLGNTGELVGFLAERLGEEKDAVERAVMEPLNDSEFAAMLRRRTLKRALWVKVRPRFGRRLGWYAIARLRKPKLVAETGIHDGLGSALLLRALELNARDGVEGRLISFDPRPEAGWLVPERLRSRWDARFVTSDDPERGLPAALDGEEVDFFIHDSEHTHAVETFEFTTALDHAAPGCVLLSDNAHATSALKEIGSSIGREYAFYPEKPEGHWYPGAGIGLVVCS